MGRSDPPTPELPATPASLASGAAFSPDGGPGQDLCEALAAQVRQAYDGRVPLWIRGGGTKRHLAPPCAGEPLDVARHHGIVSYEPSELVLTARAGTPLAVVEAVLAAAGQMLPFEPPAFGAAATLGGTIACGSAGPRRPWGGAVRDAVLGVQMINGAGERLTFGGQVMKNVAGYDVSRLMAGARGVLGVLTQVSVKVLPRAETEVTCVLSLDRQAALAKVVAWNRSPLPLSATCHVDGLLSVRLSGADVAVRAAAASSGGDHLAHGPAFWHGLKEQTLPFFAAGAELWRYSLPHAAPMPRAAGAWLIEWAGAQRWLCRAAAAGAEEAAPAAEAASLGGHAQRWRHAWWETPPGAAQSAVQARLKLAFDPRGIFNAAPT